MDIVNFDFASPDLVMVFEGTPSYNDVIAIFGGVPGCPSKRNSISRKQKEKMKQRFSTSLNQLLKNIKQNQMIFGFEFIAVSLNVYEYHLRLSK